MISLRYSVAVVLLLLIALIPTVIHTYVGAQSDDGKSVSLVPDVLNGWTSTPYSRHKAKWVEDMYGSSDWLERIYTSPEKTDVRLFVARSYDYKRLYHHPELGLSHGKKLEREGIVVLPGEERIIVHLYNELDNDGFVAYVLLYEEGYIESPIAHQLQNVFRQLVSARKQMTIFYVSGRYANGEGKFVQTPAASILTTAIRDFRSND
jgi:hypothetical protein